jgi:hypothetical protein
MRVYHGSYTKDFGTGFYVTRYREQAESWALRKGSRKHSNGFITEFDFDDFHLEEMFKWIKNIIK